MGTGAIFLRCIAAAIAFLMLAGSGLGVAAYISFRRHERQRWRA